MIPSPAAAGLTAAAVAIAAVVGVGVLVARRRWLLVTVHESSMEPTLTAGQRVLVRRPAPVPLRPGQVVLMRHGTDSPEDLFVKRVAALPGDPVPTTVAPVVELIDGAVVPAGRLVLLGDNPDASSDSRLVGFYRLSDVVGVVQLDSRASGG